MPNPSGTIAPNPLTGVPEHMRINCPEYIQTVAPEVAEKCEIINKRLYDAKPKTLPDAAFNITVLNRLLTFFSGKMTRAEQNNVDQSNPAFVSIMQKTCDKITDHICILDQLVSL